MSLPVRAGAPTVTVLRVEDVVAGYLRDVPILNGATVHVDDGEIVTIVGPNGAGKSTLVKAVVGLVRPSAGRVLLGTDDIAGLPPHRIARRGVGYVPQLQNVFASMTVRENLELGAVANPLVDRGRRISDLLDLFPELAERASAAAGVLSGGQRQLLAIARALVPQPRVLVLDEPSAGLSPAAMATTFQKITEINATGVTILMVEQNARQALEISDRGYVIELGRTRFEGSARGLLDDPRVAHLYLGGSLDDEQ